MINTMTLSAIGVVVFIGGFWIFISNDEADKMNGDVATIEKTQGDKSQSPKSAKGSWGDKNDNGTPIVYQKNKILNYGQFTVQYDVWFNYARVSSGETYILRQAGSLSGTKYTSKDGSVELTVVDGIGSLIRDGQVVASGELQNREEIEAMGPTSCMAITDEVIEGCQ